MPEQAAEKPGAAGISDGEIDIAALFAELSEEVRRVGPRGFDSTDSSVVRLNVRASAERLWPVSAERPPGGRAGVAGALLRPVKLVLRRLMRWYVEPVFADQRAFNDALLRLVDDLQEQVDALRAQLRSRGPA